MSDRHDGGPRLSADIYCDGTGKKWSASISEHPPKGGEGALVWEKHGMRTEHNAEIAMEAAYKRLMAERRKTDD